MSSDEEVTSLWRLLAILLHLGNMEYSGEEDSATPVELHSPRVRGEGEFHIITIIIISSITIVILVVVFITPTTIVTTCPYVTSTATLSRR
jgi:hypothetical protein